MKRLLLFLAVLVLAVGCFATAFAAKPVILKQPETKAVKPGGKLTIKIAAKNFTGLTWYFVDPVSGEQTTAKNIAAKFPGLRVSGPNQKTLTLKKVPMDMNGWTVFCRLGGNGYRMDSESVVIEVIGAPTVAPPEKTQEKEPEKETEKEPEPEKEPEVETESTKKSEQPKESEPKKEEPESEFPSISGPFTVTATGVELYELDRKGKPTGEPQTSLTFSDTADVYIKAEGIIDYLSLNGVRMTPEGNVSGLTLRGLTGETVIDARVTRVTVTPAPEEEPDESGMPDDEGSGFTGGEDEYPGEDQQSGGDDALSEPKAETFTGETFEVTCTYCYFTGGGNSFVSSGRVPAGTVITVTAGREGNLENGYHINGGEAENPGVVSFKYTVTGPTEITMDYRPITE